MNIGALASEFEQKYVGCFFYVTYEGGQRYLSFFRKLYLHRDTWVMVLNCRELGETLLKFETLCEFSFDFPPDGLFNCDNGCLLFQKQPNRQWKRALCRENGSIKQPLGFLKSVISSPEFDYATIEAAHAAKHVSMRAATDQLRAGSRYSAALSPRLGLCLNPTSEKENLLFVDNGTTIGTIQDSNPIRISLGDPYFKQELIDLAYRTGEQISVS